MFASKLLYLSILLFVSLVSSTCTKGRADTCSNNPNPSYQENDYNYHPTTCNDKWDHCKDPNNPNSQKPQAYYLCTSKGQPSGGVPVDWYTLSIQNLGFAPVAYTLHGLWPGSYFGRNDKDQPFGCQNAEEFNQTYLTTFGDLFTTFWPTDPTRGNTQYCFILSEWMKHGTCAVINGQEDSSTFRLNQDTYYRTAIVLANEYNQNSDLRQVWPESQVNGPSGANFPISVGCVQCAYWATVGWTDTTVDSVPRMSSTCLDQCILCNSHTCYAANLDSTINFDPSNAPALPSVMTRTVPTMASASFVATGDSDTNAKKTEKKAETTAASKKTTPTSKSSDFLEGGVWRSFGAEQIGSGKFEFAQQFSDQSFTSTTDSPYPQKCLYSSQITGQDTENVKLTNCGSNNHTETCIVQHLKEVGNLEVAFFACNHSGSPAPVDFQAAMDTPQCGNFLMFRCKKLPCSFSPVVSNAGYVDSIYENFGIAPTDKSHVGYERSHQGVAGAPPVLLGTWRALEVSQFYQTGLARWNFTSDAQATIEWPNYPTRSIERYAVSHGKGRNFYLTDSGGHIKSCIFDFKYNEVYSYAVFACGPDDGDAPKNFNDAFNQPNTQYAMGRCNPCSPNCRYSCSATNNNCGIGPSCHAHTEEPASKSKSNTNQTTQDTWTPPNWCKPGEVGCWPTKSEIQALEQQLGPNDARTGLKWFGYPQPQTGPVPDSSIDNQTLYGLGFNDTNGLKALYYYENLQDLTKPCFTGKSTPSQLNSVSDMCKAAVRQGEYRDWNPFIVVFPLNERHVTRALEFAAKHRLCISVAGTGHEYLSRNVCPAGGILIRMLLFKEKSFLSSWKEDPQISPDGAFRFGAGATFSEMHHFSATKNRIIASGWCSTVGMVGFHLGGGHGPFAPSMGLGVDNLLEIEVLQIGRDSNGRTKVHKLIASRRSNPQLFWAMRGGGGGVWGVILSMTIRAHALPSGGSVNRVFITQSGTFCPGSGQFGYEWLRDMWTRFAHWNLMINQKVSTQAAFFIDPSKYSSGGLCAVTWTFNFEYFYAGSQSEPNYKLFRDKLKNEVMEASKVTETNYKNVFDYVQSMKADQFLLKPGNPLPDPHSPSDNATGSQNSVLVSRQAMEAHFAATMMDVLDICVSSLQNKDPTSPDPSGYRCGFHYLYTSVTGNLGSEQPSGTAISPGFRHALMLWNARTLSTDQIRDTLYRIGTNSYFSESSFVMHDWVDHYWGKPIYDQLLAVKKAHDPDNRFWCRHCVGDNPNDAYGNPLGASQDSFV